MTAQNQSIIETLVREELIDMVPYQSARRLQKAADDADASSTNVNQIWLNANEASGLGTYQLSADRINRYPDFQPDSLIDAYSEYANIDNQHILATRGADEGIELIIRTFCRAYRDSILICPPTYGMYAISAKNHSAGVIEVPLINNVLDVSSIVEHATNKAQVKVVFLCSPGNPIGNILPKTQIEAVLAGVNNQAIVVVDEAYIEFCPETSVKAWLSQHPNLIILRTLSKAFALAGLRCGFTLASTEIITMLSKVIAPYPISAPVAEIASKALNKNGVIQMNKSVQETNTLKHSLSDWLKKQAWCEHVFASDANFVLFKTPYKDLIFNYLKQQGILIRDQSKQVQLNNCLRISIGSEQELNCVKQSITQLMASSTNNQQQD